MKVDIWPITDEVKVIFPGAKEWIRGGDLVYADFPSYRVQVCWRTSEFVKAELWTEHQDPGEAVEEVELLTATAGDYLSALRLLKAKMVDVVNFSHVLRYQGYG